MNFSAPLAERKNAKIRRTLNFIGANQSKNRFETRNNPSLNRNELQLEPNFRKNGVMPCYNVLNISKEAIDDESFSRIQVCRSITTVIARENSISFGNLF